MIRVLASVLFMIAALPAAAERERPGALARAAAADLVAAQSQLAAAEDARDRVRALTETIQAYEAGLEALREGIRRATIRRQQIEKSLTAREAEIAQLLAMLQAVAPRGTPAAFLHPAGATGTARAGMLLADLTPTLNRAAAALRTDLEDVTILRDLQQDAVNRLQKGLTEVQTARTALNQAMANRTDLPMRLTEDPVRTAILLSSSETLDAFSSNLDEIAVADVGWEPPDLADRKGALPWPVRGVILRLPGEPDAAGISRPGLLLAARPAALVTSPTAATLRYVGPLLDLGTVVILEPQPGTLFVLAGLGVAYGETGQIVAAGAPLGLMGVSTPAELSKDSEGAGTARSETLYIETRQENLPVDPLNWFRAPENG